MNPNRRVGDAEFRGRRYATVCTCVDHPLQGCNRRADLRKRVTDALAGPPLCPVGPGRRPRQQIQNLPVKHLIKIMLILGLVFGSTFVAGRLLGILTTENVRHLLEQAQSVDPVWVAGLVVALLFIDLFFAVPTLTITILAGFFLGFPAGASAAFVGASLAAIGGYLVSRRWGDRVIRMLLKEEAAREDLVQAFHSSGPVMIMFSRALPMVPEITACMAGVTRMPPLRYAAFFTVGTLPYVLLAAYAGSISSLESPQPAIYAALLFYGLMWTGWYVFRRTRAAQR